MHKNFHSIIFFKIIVSFLILINLVFTYFISSTDRILSLDEARYIPAGVAHWRLGEFGLANDSPPLARIVGTLPLACMKTIHVIGEEFDDLKNNLYDSEFKYASHFMLSNNNKRSFHFFVIARITNVAWCSLGVWVIFRWSRELYGDSAGCLGVVLWLLSPNVLWYEHIASTEFPVAIACLSSTYGFRRYLLAPTWSNALVVGLLLGIAQLTGFSSLVLFFIWPLLTVVHRVSRIGPSPASLGHHNRLCHAGCIIACSLYILNLGYGFTGSGIPLGNIQFTSHTLVGEAKVTGMQSAAGDNRNRFNGSWVGLLPSPVPVDYLKGIDRQLDQWGVSWEARGRIGTKIPSILSASATTGVSTGVWGMALCGLLSLICRHPEFARRPGELAVWVPALVILAMSTNAVGLLPTAPGLLLATPFGVIIASKFACVLSPVWNRVGLTTVISIISISIILIIYNYNIFVTPELTTRFHHDLSRQGRNLGLHLLETPEDTSAEGHGLFYRTFVDSQGVTMNYAVFVPEKYRGDRSYPLILFLHGFGDRGTAGRKFTEVGLPFTLGYREIDFVVLCPQGHTGSWDASGDDAHRAMELLTAVQEQYRIDPKRIYLTGVSSGGAGVWNLAARYPHYWAAVVPVAGICDSKTAHLIKNIPCWCFHNSYDGVFPVTASRKMIEQMRALGGSPKYTEYIDVTHSAWFAAYNDIELYEWLLRQRIP